MKKQSIYVFSIVAVLLVVVSVITAVYLMPNVSHAFWDDASGTGERQITGGNLNVVAPPSGTSGTEVGATEKGIYYNPTLKYYTYKLYSSSSDTAGTALTDMEYTDQGIVLTYSGTIGDDAYIEITGYKGNLPTLYIPSSVKVGSVDVKVTKISGITSTTASRVINSIEIPSSVTEISRGCFSGFNLKSLAFTGTRTQNLNIGARAFARSVKSGTTTVTVAGESKSKDEFTALDKYSLGANAFQGWS